MASVWQLSEIKVTKYLLIQITSPAYILSFLGKIGRITILTKMTSISFSFAPEFPVGKDCGTKLKPLSELLDPPMQSIGTKKLKFIFVRCTSLLVGVTSIIWRDISQLTKISTAKRSWCRPLSYQAWSACSHWQYSITFEFLKMHAYRYYPSPTAVVLCLLCRSKSISKTQIGSHDMPRSVNIQTGILSVVIRNG